MSHENSLQDDRNWSVFPAEKPSLRDDCTDLSPSCSDSPKSVIDASRILPQEPLYTDPNPLISVNIQSSYEKTHFDVSTKDLLQRELEMRQAAENSESCIESWKGSRLYIDWQIKAQSIDHFPGEANKIVLPLSPESEMQDYYQFEWRSWMTDCIRGYYETGFVRIPEHALGYDILLALEFFGILTADPSVLVFECPLVISRVKMWSLYFQHRATLARWILSESTLTSSKIWITSTNEQEETREGCILAVNDGSGSIFGTDKDQSFPSYQLIHYLFFDNESSNEISMEVPRKMRRDFCDQVRRMAPRKVTVSFDVERVKITTAQASVTSTLRAVLRVSLFSELEAANQTIQKEASSNAPHTTYTIQTLNMMPLTASTNGIRRKHGNQDKQNDESSVVFPRADENSIVASAISEEINFHEPGDKSIDLECKGPVPVSERESTTILNQKFVDHSIPEDELESDLERRQVRELEKGTDNHSISISLTNTRDGCKDLTESIQNEKLQSVNQKNVVERDGNDSKSMEGKLTGALQRYNSMRSSMIAKESEFSNNISMPVGYVNTQFGDLRSVTSGLSWPVNMDESTVCSESTRYLAHLANKHNLRSDFVEENVSSSQHGERTSVDNTKHNQVHPLTSNKHNLQNSMKHGKSDEGIATRKQEGENKSKSTECDFWDFLLDNACGGLYSAEEADKRAPTASIIGRVDCRENDMDHQASADEQLESEWVKILCSSNDQISCFSDYPKDTALLAKSIGKNFSNQLDELASSTCVAENTESSNHQKDFSGRRKVTHRNMENRRNMYVQEKDRKIRSDDINKRHNSIAKVQMDPCVEEARRKALMPLGELKSESYRQWIQRREELPPRESRRLLRAKQQQHMGIARKKRSSKLVPRGKANRQESRYELDEFIEKDLHDTPRRFVV